LPRRLRKRLVTSHDDLYDRLHRLLTALDAEHAWAISPHDRERYVAALAPLLAELPPEQWPAVAANYHADHQLVASLRDAAHPDHERAWSRYAGQVLGVLRRAGRDWSRDGAIDADDLAQIARAELVRALPGYRYRSRFSSWAYSVISRCARDQIRFATTLRRSGATVSLQELTEAVEPADPQELHERAARARLLAERIAAVLDAHPDRRLRRIFHLSAVEERTSAEIGELVNLHESRVRALLKLARELLRADPAIRAWLEDEHQ
jgi:RNA polymerase sigma factor (sigma-70 family)